MSGTFTAVYQAYPSPWTSFLRVTKYVYTCTGSVYMDVSRSGLAIHIQAKCIYMGYTVFLAELPQLGIHTVHGSYEGRGTGASRWYTS